MAAIPLDDRAQPANGIEGRSEEGGWLRWWPGSALACLALGAVACGPVHSPATGGDQPPRLDVLATTGIVGDVVAHIGRDRIALRVLVPPTSDAHAFVPAPRDLVAVAEADVIFGSGLGLEAFLEGMVASAGARTPILLAEGDQGVDGGPRDPHVWLDVQHVIGWTDRIADALAAADPDGAAAYGNAARAYRLVLEDLDAWIVAELAAVPTERRAIVSDHRALGAFCARYGCRVVGAIIPSSSTEADASPRHIVALEAAIAREGIRAIVIDGSAGRGAAERLAATTGAAVVPLYIEALGPAGSGAETYAGMMRHNVERLVAALR